MPLFRSRPATASFVLHVAGLWLALVLLGAATQASAITPLSGVDATAAAMLSSQDDRDGDPSPRPGKLVIKRKLPRGSQPSQLAPAPGVLICPSLAGGFLIRLAVSNPAAPGSVRDPGLRVPRAQAPPR